MRSQFISAVFIASSLLLQGCSSSESEDNSPKLITNSIVGTWEALVEEQNCHEYFTFNDDNTFETESFEKRTSGTYEFLDTVERGGQHLLVMDQTSNNGAQDCTGTISEQEREIIGAYIHFPRRDVSEWFSSEDGSALMEATRI